MSVPSWLLVGVLVLNLISAFASWQVVRSTRRIVELTEDVRRKTARIQEITKP